MRKLLVVPYLALPLVALPLFALAAFTAGCGDDSGTGGAGGASSSADASGATTATAATGATGSTSGNGSTSASSSTVATVGSSTATGGATLCGDEPYVDAHIVVRSYITEGLVEGAELTVNLCPGLSILSNADGEIDASIEQGQPFQARFVATNHLPMRLGEQQLDDVFEADVPLFPNIATALLPEWSEDNPSMMVLIDVHEDELEEDDPCASAEGWEVSVIDHPEAEVLYFSGDSTPNPDPDLEATGPIGLASPYGLTATDGEASIRISATKDGCDDAVFESYPFTGGHSLENGVLTVAVGRVPELPPAR